MRAAGPGRRAPASGGTRRAAGLRGGTGRTELLLFEWVWGQKLKSSPAGGQQSLFLGVFTSTSTKEKNQSSFCITLLEKCWSVLAISLCLV